jgi:hypothetical protein
MNLKGFIQYHKLSVAIIIYLIIFFILHQIKPSIVYDENGAFRDFGVGYSHKTVVPIWLVSILLSILIYTFVLYLIEFVL